MAYQSLGIGGSANDGTGDTLRAASDKINDNFLEIYTLIGDASSLSTGISATASVITLTAPSIATSIAPSAADGATLGTASLEFSDLYLADGGIIYLGDDQDINITHVADTGITTNGTFQATTITATTAVVPDASDGAALGTTALEWSDLYLADGGIIYFGDDQDINITHVADTGITTSGTFQATTITATTAVVPDASDGAALGTTALEWSDLYLADGAVIGFGDDQEVTLTHVADTGLLLSSTDQLQFGDSGTYIHQSADGVLDLVSDTEIELTATTIDVNGNLDVSGTLTQTGVATFAARDIHSGGITIANDGQIGSAGDADAIAISSSGVVTMTQIPVFSAGLNVSGGTIAGTLSTVAQTNITSLGTLTALTVDDVAINGKVITMTGDTSDTVVFTAGAAGTLSIVTTDAAGAAGNIQITADGTVDIDSAGVLTLDSGAAINIEPAAGSAILLDGTISIDAGVVTGATSITSTAFVGDITGDVTGTADVATVATTVTITDNESTNESNALIFTAGGDVDGGNLGLESDGTLTYNPSTGKVTATGFIGTLTGNVTGNASGTAATVTGAAQTNITSVGTLTALQVDNININTNTISTTAGTDLLITPVAGQQIVLDGTIIIDAGVVTGATSITSTAFVGDITGDVTGTADTATVATTVTITDNESTDEDNAIIFTAGGDVDGGNIGLESDGTLTYNPSTGKITATGFIGTLTGNVTGNLAGTVTTATQNSITTATGLVSVGALDSGSITSGFTSIDVGAGTITTTGAITGGSVAGRKTIVSTFNTTSAVTASLTAAQSGATILIDGTEDNVINLPAAATTNPGIFYDLIVRVAVAGDKTTIVNIAGSGGGFVGALSLAGGTAANAVLDNAGDALTFVNSTVVGSRARITCIVDDGTDGTWQVECLASPIATIA